MPYASLTLGYCLLPLARPLSPMHPHTQAALRQPLRWRPPHVPHCFHASLACSLEVLLCPAVLRPTAHLHSVCVRPGDVCGLRADEGRRPADSSAADRYWHVPSGHSALHAASDRHRYELAPFSPSSRFDLPSWGLLYRAGPCGADCGAPRTSHSRGVFVVAAGRAAAAVGGVCARGGGAAKRRERHLPTAAGALRAHAHAAN